METLLTVASAIIVVYALILPGIGTIILAVLDHLEAKKATKK